MKRHHSLSFTAEGEGRIDAVAAREQDIPRSVFSSDSVSIAINGRPAKKSAKVKAGDSIAIEYDEEVFPSLEAEDIPLDTVYEDDDILVIDKSLELIEGDLAVCYVDGEFTVKRVSIEGDTVWLVPSNPDYPRIKVTADNDFMVWGIVTYTIKKNRRRR